MLNIFTSADPLAANQVLNTQWLDRAGSGDTPFLVISALADQAGSFQLYESEARDTEFRMIGGCVITPGTATVINVNIRTRFVKLVYTNGPTAQAAFAITILGSATPHLAPLSRDWRALDLILRELRLQSLLLSELKAPYASTVNLPFGPNNAAY
jgi:hypothetical protein